MSNISVIENKISSAKKYIKILENYKKYSRKEIEQNLHVRGALERYLYLTIQSAIHLAEAIIAFKKYRKPAILSEAFYILSDEGVISSELAEKMSKMVGFRNILSHDYDKLNYDIVYDVLHNRLADIENFIKEVSKFLQI